MTTGTYQPDLPPERVDRLRRWHEEAAAGLRALGAYDTRYLGLDLHVPDHVFGPTPTSDLMGRCVIDAVEPSDRVLDMGCGAGGNALLAARITDAVVAVDVNAHAVAATAANADRNGLRRHVDIRQSDLFTAVDGTFDLIVIDPPFRWFAPADDLERAITDENYETLARFLHQAPGRLRAGGAILLFFGTSGDVAHLDRLSDRAGFASATIAERTIHVRGEDTTYFVRRLTL